MGVKVGEKKLGSLGDVSFFSLGRGKNITCGSGGIIVTDSEGIAEAVRNIHETLKREPILESVIDVISVFMLIIFINPCLYWFPYGLPILKLGETKFYQDFPVFQFSGFKAGLLHRWREHLDGYNHGRSATGEYYLKELHLENTLSIYSRSVPYLRFPIYVEENLLKTDMDKDYGILGVTRMYPDSINNVKEIRHDCESRECYSSEKIAKNLLTLPTHPFLRQKDKDNICRMIRHVRNAEVA
jgi:dTDP-4-amino-4,6-dideoxygalactose transaminase